MVYTCVARSVLPGEYYPFLINFKGGAGEMVQQVRAPATLAEDLGLVLAATLGGRLTAPSYVICSSPT